MEMGYSSLTDQFILLLTDLSRVGLNNGINLAPKCWNTKKPKNVLRSINFERIVNNREWLVPYDNYHDSSF